MRRVDLANWALQTSPKFITRVKYQFHQDYSIITVIMIIEGLGYVLDGPGSIPGVGGVEIFFSP